MLLALTDLTRSLIASSVSDNSGASSSKTASALISSSASSIAASTGSIAVSSVLVSELVSLSVGLEDDSTSFVSSLASVSSFASSAFSSTGAEILLTIFSLRLGAAAGDSLAKLALALELDELLLEPYSPTMESISISFKRFSATLASILLEAVLG